MSKPTEHETKQKKLGELYKLVKYSVEPIVMCAIAIENWNGPDIHELKKEMYQDPYYDILGLLNKLISDDFVDVEEQIINPITGNIKSTSKSKHVLDAYCHRYRDFILKIVKDIIDKRSGRISRENILSDFVFGKAKEIHDKARENRIMRMVDPTLLVELRKIEEKLFD